MDSYKKIENDLLLNLQKLIRIESVESAPQKGMPFGKGVSDALNFYLELAKGFGLETKNYDGYAGEITLPAEGATESVAVLVHLDVVPAGEGWSVPPFSGEIKDGKIWGRGATDDKGAAVVCLYALKALLESGAKLKKNIVLIAGCDEESGQLCMQYYKKHAEMPETGFSPDADFPLINCEKTILQLKLLLPCDKAFSGLVAATDCGGRANIVPENASAKLVSGQSISFKGRAAHAMEAFTGDNAIHKLVRELKRLLGAGEKSAAVEFMSDCLCDTDGAGLGIKAEDGKSGALTMNFAALKLTGGKLEITLDLRCPLSKDVDSIMSAINSRMPSGGKTEIIYHQPGIYVSPDSPLVKTLLTVYEKVTGRKGNCILSGGGTYARQLKNGVAFGPSDQDIDYNIHSADEFAFIKQLEEMFEIYYEAIKELAR